MKHSVLSLLACAGLLVGLSACGKKEDATTTAPVSTTTTETVEQPTVQTVPDTEAETAAADAEQAPEGVSETDDEPVAQTAPSSTQPSLRASPAPASGPATSARFKEGTAADAANPLLWMNLGRAQLGLNQSGLARESLEKALSLQPNWLPAVGALAFLEVQEGESITNTATKDSANNISSTCIGWQLSIGDSKRDCAHVVGDYPHGDISLLIGLIGDSGGFAYEINHRRENIGIVIGGLALDGHAKAFKSHSSVNILGRQRF